MKIGIIGAGHIGATAARLFLDAGHEVAVSNSRDPETLAPLVAELGPKAQAATPESAAQFGDVVLVAIPLKSYPTLPAEDLRGKVVVDAMNYYPERDGHYAEIDSGTQTSTELVAQHLEGARIVKAFNTIWFEHLKRQGDRNAPIENRRAIFVAGDDADAKRTVSQLIADIGFGAVDTGSLSNSGVQQPGSPIYNKDITVAAAREELADR
jgi:8-hydroxy-5-deazaflavin:NADPH oxidoreductase